jgi:glycine cleavage system aminomethyltransferase T/glycine/D-amino acid oxidase-like deaminating enzyme
VEALPTRASVVIVGGGAIGCSIAYHLTKLGVSDVVLLEKHALTAGTTWHAAGLITSAGFHDETSLWFCRYSRDLYSRLEEETGHSTGFRPVGHLSVTSNPERMEAIVRERDFQVGFGVPNELVTPEEIAELFPMAKVDDLIGGSYVADEGRADPVGVATALAKGAKMGGATIIEGVRVTGFDVAPPTRSGARPRITGVRTDQGDIEAETVILSAGLWTRQLAAAIGVDVPLQAAEHYYLLTEPMEGIHRDLPIIEELDCYGYFREEGGGMLVGLFEPVGAGWHPEGAPEDFAFGTIPPDWERMTPFLDKAMARIPALDSAGIRTFFCGPESFTADVAPMLGPTPEMQGLWVAAGLNSLGILQAGGVGSLMATWIVDGSCPVDIAGYTVERATPVENSRRFRSERIVEQLGVSFGDGTYPTYHPHTARDIRRSPLHDVWVAHRAHFAVASAWEFVEWFYPEGEEVRDIPWTWGRGFWSPWVAEEHRTVREAVGAMDMTLMSKFLVQGPDAATILDRLSANAVAGAVGAITYTQWCNDAGGILADLTVTRLAEDRFMVIVSDISHRRVECMLRDEVREGEFATITDMTAGYCLLTIQGPRSRELLQRVSPDDLSNDAFPYLTAREIEVGYSRVTALRVTYVGELGYELLIPSDQAVSVWRTLEAAGGDLGFRPVGLAAMHGLRLEKAYRDYGIDIDVTDSPVSAGLSFAVAWDKPVDFRGRAALERLRGDRTSRLVPIRIDDPAPLLHGGEGVYKDGSWMGYVQAGGFGHTLGTSVGLATVDNSDGVTAEWLASGGFEVVINGTAYPATVQFAPFYDPDRTRVRG